MSEALNENGLRPYREAIRQRVHAAGSVDQMALLEAELWSFDADLIARYWQEVNETLTHMNAELQSQASEAAEHWWDDAQSAAQALAERSLPKGIAPLGTWFTPPPN